MSTPTQSRRPAGSPAGGQFAPASHAESDVDLADDRPATRVVTGRHRVHLADSVHIPDGTRERLDTVLDGIEQLGCEANLDFEVTDVSGTASGVGVRVVDRGTEEAYSVEATSAYVHVSAEGGPVSSDAFLLAEPTPEGLSGKVAGQLRDVATIRQCQVALDRRVAALTVPAGVEADTSLPGAPQFSRGDGQYLRVDADEQRVYVTTRVPHPITGAVVEDHFEVTSEVDGDGDLHVTAGVEWDGPSRSAPQDPTTGLAAWMDGITGGDRFLHGVAADQMLAQARYRRQYDEAGNRA